DSEMAANWRSIADFVANAQANPRSATRNPAGPRKMIFRGALSQRGACDQQGGCVDTRSGTRFDNTPSQSWNQLYDALNGLLVWPSRVDAGAGARVHAAAALGP